MIEPKQHIKRSKHVRLKARLAPEQVKQMMAWRQQNLPKTMADLEKAEEAERLARDSAEAPDILDRNVTPLFQDRQGVAIPVAPLPPGRHRDAVAAEELEADIVERVRAENIGANLPVSDEARHVYRLLLAYSQKPPPNKRATGWRTTDLAAAGADVWIVLGYERPEEPVGGWNLTHREKPEISPEMRLDAARLMTRATTELRGAGLLRDLGMLTEISIAGVN